MLAVELDHLPKLDFRRRHGQHQPVFRQPPEPSFPNLGWATFLVQLIVIRGPQDSEQ